MKTNKDVQAIMEFNRVIKNYLKMKRIELRVDLNEEIKLNTTIFKPIEIIGELPSMYRVYNVEVSHGNRVVKHRQLHELHLIALKKRSNESTN